jgi:hypothetical protein
MAFSWPIVSPISKDLLIPVFGKVTPDEPLRPAGEPARMAGMEDQRRHRRALWAGYLAAAMPLLVGITWDLIFQYKVTKAAPTGWTVDSAPPHLVQFLIPVGFFGFVAFALGHGCIVLYKKISG